MAAASVAEPRSASETPAVQSAASRPVPETGVSSHGVFTVAFEALHLDDSWA